MENEASARGIFQLLDDNIKRSNKLGDIVVDEIIDLTYWEIRYILPELIMEGVDALCDHFCKKNHPLAEKVSFYFFIKDELEYISKMEKEKLRRMHVPDGMSRPSQRFTERYYLIELYRLADWDVIKAEKIKKMKYSVIFETLLAKVIQDDDDFLQYKSINK